MSVCVCRRCRVADPALTFAASPPLREPERSASPSYERPPARDRVTATERASRRNVDGVTGVGTARARVTRGVAGAAFEHVAVAEGAHPAATLPVVTREDAAFGFARPTRPGRSGMALKEKPLPGAIDADIPFSFGSELGSAGEALGSTQSGGCAGDFCDVDLLSAADAGAV